MIRRSVRRHFRTVYWSPPAEPIPAPSILVPNHHGWFDGYLMYHVVTSLGLRSLDWIQEFDAFPLFSKVGGMPYPIDDPIKRAQTVRRTIRLMRDQARSLVLFAEGQLHPPPTLLSFGRALEVVASKVPSVSIIPVAIRYEMSLHQRPEAYIGFAPPVPLGEDLALRTHTAVATRLESLGQESRQSKESFNILVRGTLDVNERWDMRRFRNRSEKPAAD